MTDRLTGQMANRGKFTGQFFRFLRFQFTLIRGEIWAAAGVPNWLHAILE